jgi:hypothetical protein
LKKIDTKEYQDLVDLFERYKLFHQKYGNFTTTEQEDKILRHNILKLKGSYAQYELLLSELKACIQNYRTTKDFIKVKLNNQTRKMNSIIKNKK